MVGLLVQNGARFRGGGRAQVPLYASTILSRVMKTHLFFLSSTAGCCFPADLWNVFNLISGALSGSRKQSSAVSGSCRTRGGLGLGLGSEQVQEMDLQNANSDDEEADPLGLGLGLGSEQVQEMDLPDTTTHAEEADPLGLGLELGLGGDAAESASTPAAPQKGETQRLLIRKEC